MGRMQFGLVVEYTGAQTAFEKALFLVSLLSNIAFSQSAIPILG